MFTGNINIGTERIGVDVLCICKCLSDTYGVTHLHLLYINIVYIIIIQHCRQHSVTYSHIQIHHTQNPWRMGGNLSNDHMTRSEDIASSGTGPDSCFMTQMTRASPDTNRRHHVTACGKWSQKWYPIRLPASVIVPDIAAVAVYDHVCFMWCICLRIVIVYETMIMQLMRQIMYVLQVCVCCLL